MSNWMFQQWFSSLKNNTSSKPSQQILYKPAIINQNYYQTPPTLNKDFIPFDEKPYAKQAPAIRAPIYMEPKKSPLEYPKPPIKKKERKAPQIMFVENKKKSKPSKHEESKTIGKCTTMCPFSEIEARQESNDWSIFELDRARTCLGRIQNNEPQLIGIKFAIKKYERCGAVKI